MLNNTIDQMVDIICSSNEHVLITKTPEGKWYLTSIGVNEEQAIDILKKMATSIRADNVINLSDYKKQELH